MRSAKHPWWNDGRLIPGFILLLVVLFFVVTLTGCGAVPDEELMQQKQEDCVSQGGTWSESGDADGYNVRYTCDIPAPTEEEVPLEDEMQ